MEPKKIKEILDRDEKKGRDELNRKKSVHYSAVYEGKLPDNFMAIFKKAMFKLAPKDDNVPAEILKSWVVTDVANLTVGQVGKMIDFITVVPKSSLYETLEESIEYQIPLELVAEKLRAKNQLFEQEIKKEENDLMEKLQKKQMTLINAPGQVKPQKSTLKKVAAAEA